MRQFKRAVSIALGANPDSLKAPNYGVLTTLNSDESVARGCALMCAMASPQFREFLERSGQSADSVAGAGVWRAQLAAFNAEGRDALQGLGLLR